MRRYLLSVVFLFLLVQSALATHQRAAEITYRHIEGLTYEFTITMYTRTSSPADDERNTMPIFWGDGSSDEIPRIDFYPLGNDISYNRYVGRHTYAGPGAFTITVEDPNRNNGVVNIPNSVNVPMFIDSYLVINPFLGYNNSVQLLNAPIDEGCVGQPFYHNPGAYDPDGDSLSYKLVVCKGAGGKDIPGYTFPKASDYFRIDTLTGEIQWVNPILQGEYNVAFLTEEWRRGVMIGYVRRDMQITIVSCHHKPPLIITANDTCVTAGDSIHFKTTTIDPEGTDVTLSAFGGPFVQPVSPAKINPDPAKGNDTVSTVFSWHTVCDHVRNKAYIVGFKAKDSGFPISLASFKTVKIKVIAPAPENLTASALGNGINLHWDTTNCKNAIGYKIYRKNDSTFWQPGVCETGVPAYTGFRLLATLNSIKNTTFRDDNGGNGLSQGIRYCYRVTTIFADGAESYASAQACASLKRDVPIITHVSNDKTDLTKGYVYVDWAKPTELDTVQYPGPYQYILYRSDKASGGALQPVKTFSGLNDTVYLDKDIQLNNEATVTYRVNLKSTSTGDIGSSQTATSLFLKIRPSDKKLLLSWDPQVPWINDRFIIYRKEENKSTFDSLTTVTAHSFIDRHLNNTLQYCYYIKSVGHFSLPGLVNPVINYSQIACAVPKDVIPPCQPYASVSTDCRKVDNTVKIWMNPVDSCFYDLEKYRIYYAAPGEDLQLIDSVAGNHGDTVYFDHSGLESVVGCYEVSAVDSTGNASDKSQKICVDYNACPQYALPNVFTPNGDGTNDKMVPLHLSTGNPKATVDHVEMKIFNRWGKEVFHTSDPMINWDGKNITSGEDCAAGVYFYTCEVYFHAVNGLMKQHLQGSVTIIR
jgi:gliding motility-associated-like protein